MLMFSKAQSINWSFVLLSCKIWTIFVLGCRDNLHRKFLIEKLKFLFWIQKKKLNSRRVEIYDVLRFVATSWLTIMGLRVNYTVFWYIFVSQLRVETSSHSVKICKKKRCHQKSRISSVNSSVVLVLIPVLIKELVIRWQLLVVLIGEHYSERR